MESNIRQSIGEQQTQQSNADFSYEENIIDLDSPIERISTVIQNQPIQASVSSISRSDIITGSASSHDSEDSNGFVKVEHPANDLLGDFEHSYGDVPLEPERIPHDFLRGEDTTPSDETSSLSSDMDQQHVLPKASELAESTFERVSDVAASGYEKVSGATTAATDAAKSVFDTMGDTAHNIYGSAADKTKSAEQKATEVAHDIFGAVSDTAKAAQDKAAEAAHTAYTTAADTVKTVEEKTSTAAHATSDLLGETIHLVHEKADDAYDSVAGMAHNAKEVGHDAFGAVTEKADDLYTSAKGSVQGAYDTVTGAAHEAADGVKEGTHDVFGTVLGATKGIKEKTRDVAEAAKESIEAAYEKGAEAVHGVGEKGREAVGFAEGKFEDEYDKLSDVGHAAYDTTADALKGTGERVEGAVHTAYGKTSDTLKGVDGALEGAAYTAYDTTSSTMKSAGEALGSAAHETVKKVKDAGELGVEKAKEFVGGADEDFDLFDPLKQVAEKVTRGVEDLHGTGFDSFQDTVRSEVAGVHDQIDSLIQKMHEDAQDAQAHFATQQKSTPAEAVGLSSESNVYGRGSSPDEHTFNRKGPLTIPSPKEEKADDSLVHLDDEPKAVGGFDDMEPRPPTPPKELDDEDVKPTTIDVGPPPPYKASITSDRPRSILKHSGQGPWFDFKSVDPRLLDLIYWRDPKKSAIVLSVSIILLLIFAKFPLISVLSYLGLAVLGGTLGFRLYKIAEAQLKKTDGANPFQLYLEKELNVPQERVHQQVDVLIEHGQLIANQLRRLFLVENITDSAKFGLLLWALTYVGSWFSGLCILLLVVLGVFSIPKFYEVYQEPIDRNFTIAKEHINNVTNTMNEKLPFLKKITGTHEKTN